MSIRSSWFVLLASVVFAFGCPTGDVGDDDDGSDDDDAAPYVQPAPWDDLDEDQRLEFMRELFEPQMREVFQGFDGMEFEEFKCETCHGTDMEEADYAMPNGLIPLDNRGNPAEPSYRAEEMEELMDDEVVPLGQELLEQPDAGQNQWGCFACHEQR
jgi:hypothetical protein